MIKKATILIFGYLFLGIATSCDRNLCKDILDYYDFSEIHWDVEESTLNILETDTLNFTLKTEIEYLAHQHSFNLFSSAYALSCLEHGNQGMKFPMTKIEITSNSDFDENHPAGAVLNDIIYIIKTVGEPVTKLMDEFAFESIFTSVQGDRTSFLLPTQPDVASEHVFTMKVYKSNGDIVSSESEIIIWE